MELEERRVESSADSRLVTRFALLIGATALAATCLLVAGGTTWPQPGPVLVLALVLLLAVNRFALFPNEHAVTAEAAVLLAAVVAFRDDAAFLGPMLLALLVGPLDVLHWAQRSFLRMAYNAGNRGLSTFAAAGAFAATSDILGGSTSVLGVGVATVCAVALFVTVDLALSVTLLRLQSEQSLTAAVREILAIDVLAVPTALAGAACGFLQPVVGWWAVAVALVPLVFLPEVALARTRWRLGVVRDVVIVGAVLGTMASLAMFGPRPPPTTLVALVALAWILCTAFGTDRWRVPPLLALLVTAAAVVTDDRSAFLVAMVTAITGSVAAAWARGRVLPHAFVLVLALVGAVSATVIARSSPSTLPGVAVGALLAGLVFGVVAVLPGGVRRANAQLVWATPVLAGAAACGLLWRVSGTGGSIAFAAGTVALAITTPWWGPCPWGAPPGVRRWEARTGRHLLPVLVTTELVSLVAICSALATSNDVRTATAWVGVATGESALAMVLAGTRQWRFAPRARYATLLGLLATGATVLALVPTLVLDGDAMVVPLHALCLIGITSAGFVPAKRMREVAKVRG